MLTIRKIKCPEKKINIKCPYPMRPTRIVIHNTANDASAANEIAYMHRNTRKASFHFAVDDKEAVQGIELNSNSWNAGDGTGGRGNREGIAIEICYSKSGGERWLKAVDNAAQLTAKLLKDYGWGVGKVTKHKDYTGKNCPHRILKEYGWDKFINLVKSYLDEPKKTVSKATHINDAVKTWQTAATTDGFKFKTYGIDGKWGGECEAVAKKAICKKRATYKFKNLTKIVQRAVGATADGKFGSNTKNAVIAYQIKHNLTADGVVGLNTWKKILGV